MKKTLIFLIILFIAVGGYGVYYSINNPREDTDTNISLKDEEWYPDDIRYTDSENEGEDTGSTDSSSLETELVSDENYEDFDIEDDTDSEDIAEEKKEEDPENSDNKKQDREPEDAESLDSEEETEPETETEPAEEEVSETKETEPGDSINPGEDVTGRSVEIINSRCNVRAEPDREGKIKGTFWVGDRGIIIEYGEYWSIIRVGDLEGYVSNNFWKLI